MIRISRRPESSGGGGFLFAVRSLSSWYYVDDDEAVGRSVYTGLKAAKWLTGDVPLHQTLFNSHESILPNHTRAAFNHVKCSGQPRLIFRF